MSYSLLMLLLLLLLTCALSALPSSVVRVKSSDQYPSYQDCAPLTCGNSIIRFPFGTCGLLNASCEANQAILFLSNSIAWRVVGDISNSSYSNRTLQITPYYRGVGDSSMYDWLLKGGFFNLSHADMVGTIVNCRQPPADMLINKVKRVDCTQSMFSYCFFYPESGFEILSCNSYPVIVPTNNSYNIGADKGFEQLFQRGFQITWPIPIPESCDSCYTSGGRCYSYFDSNVTQDHFDVTTNCICPNDDVHLDQCNDGYVVHYGKRLSPKETAGRLSVKDTASRLSIKHMAGIFFAICALFSIVVVSCIIVRREGKSCQRNSSEEQQSIRAFMDPVDSRPPSLENFLNYYSSQAPTRYSYNQIINYTNNLSHKIGKGGFGTVYKGKLPNGCLIAVKILDESKQSEQQFIAEVATVGTTCHINLVRLLGYCSQGSKRALVYEYMANGSLDRYIHGDHKGELDLKQLYSIAICTARGIAYLHEHCRNRIIHCDIKPQNILLDDNFLPKVADFGLAKISGREQSHISVTNRGTLGYAAPEMWSRMYGPVTDRSDVYGYGVLVMEMVGGRKNIDFEHLESSSSKFFYAEWAFKQVENGEFENLRKENMSEEDQGIAKKLSFIGLWCIQFNASRRPSMSKVVQMLEGEVDIATPPFPFSVDTHMQPSSSNQSSSTYALEIKMTNPTNT